MTLVTKHCLLCGTAEDLEELYPRTFAETDLTPAVFSARRVTEHFHYTIVRCRNCGMLFSREVLPEETLARLYAQSSVTFGQYSDIIRKDYWRCLAPFMPPGLRGAALEIGCSNGFFLEELLDQGFTTVAGSEPSLEAKAMAAPPVRETITTGFFSGNQYPAGSFDLVCSFQTLDHLNDPAAVLTACRTVLKPGGLMYIIVHDAGSLQARLLGERSPIIDVEHVYLFNKKTLPAFLQRLEFDMVAAGDVRNSYPLEYWTKMFPMPARVKALAHGTLRALHLAGVRVPLAAGNIYAIARRQA